VSNPVNAPVALQEVMASGIDFVADSDCGETLAPSAQCAIQVLFKPAISGPRIGSLEINGSDSGSPHFVALS